MLDVLLPPVRSEKSALWLAASLFVIVHSGEET